MNKRNWLGPAYGGRVLLFLILVFFAAYVWPTLYVYHWEQNGRQWRVNRITGTVEFKYRNSPWR